MIARAILYGLRADLIVLRRRADFFEAVEQIGPVDPRLVLSKDFFGREQHVIVQEYWLNVQGDGVREVPHGDRSAVLGAYPSCIPAPRNRAAIFASGIACAPSRNGNTCSPG